MVEPTHFAVYGRDDYGSRHYIGDDPAKCPLCSPHLLDAPRAFGDTWRDGPFTAEATPRESA